MSQSGGSGSHRGPRSRIRPIPSRVTFGPLRRGRHGHLCGPLAAAAFFLLLHASVALGHAGYERSSPGRGEAFTQPPARVEIYTSQEMAKDATKTEIMVTNPGNVRVDTGDTTVDDQDHKHISVGLKPSLPAARYVVSFRNVSDEDGEADHGQFAFYVGSPPTAAEQALDAQLAITKEADARHSDDWRRELLLILVSSAIVVALIAAGIVVARQRRKR